MNQATRCHDFGVKLDFGFWILDFSIRIPHSAFLALTQARLPFSVETVANRARFSPFITVRAVADFLRTSLNRPSSVNGPSGIFLQKRRRYFPYVIVSLGLRYTR
jgi:hypothetical protein